MKPRTAAIAALSLLAFRGGPALADDSYRVAEQLGVLIGSEEFCGLVFDQGAIDDYIRTHVKPDDLDFSTHLDTQVWTARNGSKDMSASEKTARCTQVARNARVLRLVK